MSHAQHQGTSTRPSAIMILLDVLVIFALTARWDEAWAAM